MTVVNEKRGNGFKDMVGQTCGRLEVVDAAPSIQGAAAWRCRCECGGEVVVKGTELRKGSRRSCGCLSSRPIMSTKPVSDVAAPRARGRHWVVEVNGLSARVLGTRDGEALVRFDVDLRLWECSVCGRFNRQGCGHIAAFTSRLPRDAAEEIVRLVAPKRRDAVTGSRAEVDGAAANERARAAALASSAEKRAARLALRDEEHERITGPVVTRQATQADLDRLAARRAARGASTDA